MRLISKECSWVCVIMLLHWCCNASHKPNQSVSRIEQNEGPQTSGDLPKHRDPIEAGYLNGPQTREAWRFFEQGGRYRWAQRDDFRIPDWAISAYRADIIKSIENPFESGDINHDGAYRDFALIVVDTTRQDPERFGIVIFNEPRRVDGKYQAHWLLRDKDLSGTVLDWSSGGLGVEQFFDDGLHLHCFVEWNTINKTYTCKFVRVP